MAIVMSPRKVAASIALGSRPTVAHFLPQVSAGIPVTVNNGTAVPLSTYYATLGAAQADYPHATALTDSTAWAAAQGMLNAVADARKGKCVIPAGEWHLGDRKLEIPDGVDLYLDGAHITAKGADVVYTEGGGALQWRAPIVLVGRSALRGKMASITLANSSAAEWIVFGNNADGVLVEGVRLNGNRSNHLNVHTGDPSTWNRGGGICFVSSEKATVRGVTVEDVLGRGHPAIFYARAGNDFALVEGCRVVVSGIPGEAGADAIYIGQSNGAIVQNCIVRQAGDTGVVLEGTNGGLISGCTFIECAQAVSIGSSATVAAEANTISGCSIYGGGGSAEASGANIAAIRIARLGQTIDGVFVPFGRPLAHTITGCSISDIDISNGIWIEGAQGSSISNCTMDGIDIGGNYRGVYLQGCIGTRLTGLSIRNVGSGGIWIENCDNTVISSTDVVDACRYNTGASGVYLAGVTVGETTTGSVRGLTLQNCHLYDSNATISEKKQKYGFSKGDCPTVERVSIEGCRFDDGVNANGGGKLGNVFLTGASGIVSTGYGDFQRIAGGVLVPNDQRYKSYSVAGDPKNLLGLRSDETTVFGVSDKVSFRSQDGSIEFASVSSAEGIVAPNGIRMAAGQGLKSFNAEWLYMLLMETGGYTALCDTGGGTIKLTNQARTALWAAITENTAVFRGGIYPSEGSIGITAGVSPEGVVAAPVGSLRMTIAGLYWKASGDNTNTGWALVGSWSTLGALPNAQALQAKDSAGTPRDILVLSASDMTRLVAGSSSAVQVTNQAQTEAWLDIQPSVLTALGSITIGGTAIKLLYGSGSPESVATAPAGSIYFDTAGVWWRKATGSGSSGWVQADIGNGLILTTGGYTRIVGNDTSGFQVTNAAQDTQWAVITAALAAFRGAIAPSGGDRVLTSGDGTPEGSMTAPPGSMYMRGSDGTVWRKASGTGNTGWVQIDAATAWNALTGTLDNAQYIPAKDSGGTTRNLLGLTASDYTRILAAGSAGVEITDQAGSQWALITSALANFNGAIAPQGSTARIYAGAGDPDSSVTASRGSLYARTTGKLYLKASGDNTNTGWTEITASAVTSVAGRTGAVTLAFTDLSGRATAAQMLDGTANYYLKGNGSGSNPSYAQPSFSELTGSVTTAQLPTLYGGTHTVPLAKITAGGANGSIIIDAQGRVSSITDPT